MNPEDLINPMPTFNPLKVWRPNNLAYTDRPDRHEATSAQVEVRSQPVEPAETDSAFPFDIVLAGAVAIVLLVLTTRTPGS